MFTPLAMDPGSMQEVFNTMLDWLGAKFIGSSKISVGGYQNSASAYLGISERRKRINRFLQFVAETEDPEIRSRYGFDDFKPYQVIPSYDIYLK
jgi:hypothetical protein